MREGRGYPVCTVTKKGEAALLRGGPWVYESDIASAPEDPEDGGPCDVVSGKGRYLGTALYSARSKIRLRIVTRNANDRIGPAFWERKLRWAWAYRKTVLDPEDLDACRIVFGEADAFPGLTVDKYHDLLSVQILSRGMERYRDQILPALVRILREDGHPVRGVYLRGESALREKEGLSREKGWYPLPEETVPESAAVEIRENGIRYLVDVAEGQKTGFFLDQKYNRLAAARLAAGRDVLDCFAHTGAFALNAARGGARRVTAVDSSAAAVEMAAANAARNGLDGIVDHVRADVFELLPQLEAEGARYGLIVLDPPAFAKSRRDVDRALTGYKEVNLRGMRLVERGGHLVTCSCSRFVGRDAFVSMLRSAAYDARVQLRQVEERGASPDHPVLWGAEETAYLKCFLFQVV